MVRPKDFPSPFHPSKPEVVIADQVWFAPDIESPFVFPGFEAIFRRKAPICLEYCSGNGLWIANRAATSPDQNWIGVEMKYKRIRKIWSKIQNLKLPNLLAVCGEAEAWTKRYLPEGTVDQVYINFPDPWPKNKHSKYRLIDPPFVSELARVLKPGGSITIVTDHERYSESILRLFTSSSHFSPLLEPPHFAPFIENYGSSSFEEIWRSRGLKIRYLPFVRR